MSKPAAQQVRGEKAVGAAITIAVAVVGPLVCALGVLGGVGSFATVRRLAEPWFGSSAWTVPVGIDIGIVALLAWDLLSEYLGFSWPVLRWTAWAFVMATTYLNIAAAHGSMTAAIMHAAMPVLFVTVVEGAQHLIRQYAGLAAGTRIERIPLARWLLAPRSSFLLGRRMVLWHITSYREGLALDYQRLLMVSQLQQAYGRWRWRWRAPLRERLALRLAHDAASAAPIAVSEAVSGLLPTMPASFRAESLASKPRGSSSVILAARGGTMGKAEPGQQTFRRYVLDTWLPDHVIEATTRETYTYEISKHILPWFGNMQMADIMPGDVRRWVTHLTEPRHYDGSPALCASTICGLKNLLSAVFTTALTDQVTSLHPCKGVKTPTVVLKPPPVISPQQFDAIYNAIEDPGFRLLVEVDIESGLRWGELTELRARDIDLEAQILTVSRAVAYVARRFHPDGGRFIVKEYPKDREWGRFKLSGEITAKLKAHIGTRRIAADSLLFEMPGPANIPVTSVPGYVDGTGCRHGTISGYSGGKCRCADCRRAYADSLPRWRISTAAGTPGLSARCRGLSLPATCLPLTQTPRKPVACWLAFTC